MYLYLFNIRILLSAIKPTCELHLIRSCIHPIQECGVVLKFVGFFHLIGYFGLGLYLSLMLSLRAGT